MNKRIILVTKDIMRRDYLPVYGNKVYHTPNIDALADKGTLFLRHYTAAPSSAMAYTAMFSGKYMHEIDRKDYEAVEEYDGETIFKTFEREGFKTVVMWGNSWTDCITPLTRIYGTKTDFLTLDIEQVIESKKVPTDNVLKQKTFDIIKEALKSLPESNLFVWFHLPHVLKGFSSYGADIEMMDAIVGEVRNCFGDDDIFVSADHGHMGMVKGIPVYAFHAYEPAISIPLITPRIQGLKEIAYPTSNTQLREIILDRKVSKPRYVYSDTQYYEQLNRKLAIIKDGIKYIFNKRTRSEELYDLNFDPAEEIDLLQDCVIEDGYYRTYHMENIVYYPFWDSVEDAYLNLKGELHRIWREESRVKHIKGSIKWSLKRNIAKIRSKIHSVERKGRWNSNPHIRSH